MATNPFLQDPLTKLATDLEAEAAQPLPGQQAAAPAPVQAEVPQAKAATTTEPAAPAAEAPVEGRRPTRTKSMLPPPQFQPTFEAAAKQYNVPVNVLMALGQQESGYNPVIIGQPTKWGRAKGMMQYLDSTAAGLGINPLNPDESISAAAKQIRERLDKGYSMEDAVKEHFAGPDRKLWGAKTAAYGREVMQKTAQIGDLLGASAGGQSSELQGQLDAEEPGRYKVLPAGYAQNNQSAAMPRDTYLRTFRENNPNASPAAIEQAMAQYDKTKARAPAMQGITVPDSPEAFFDQRLNQRLQGPANGIVPGLPGVLTRQQQDDADFLNIGTKTNAPTGVAANAADVGKGLKVGLNTAAQDVRELVGRIPVIGQPIVRGGDAVDQFFTGKDSGKLLADDSKAMTESMTPEMQSALKKKWYDSESGKMGPAWSDWRSYTGGLVQSLPEQALTMGPAMKLAKMAYTAKIAAGATAEVAALSAARTAQVAGSLAEGALGGAQSAREVREDVMALSPEVLAQSDAFKSLVASGLSPADAQKALAEDVATRAFVTSGLVTGAFGGMGDRAIAKLFAQKIGKSAVTGALKGFGKGAIAEGLFEELPQSMGQRLSQNEAMQKADPTRELSNDVINQGLGGAVLGGLQGGGMGAVAGARGIRQSPEQEIATEINRQVKEVDFVGGDAAARAAMDPNNEAIDPATTRKPPSQTPAAPADSAPPAPSSGKPLGDALNNAAEQPQRVVVDTPGGPVAGTLQAYQEDEQGGFTAQVVDDNGQVVTISDTDGVVITPVAPPVGPLTSAVEDVAAKQPEAAPAEQAAPIAPVEQAAPAEPAPEAAPAPEPRQPAAQQAVADMSDDELRSRLKYIAGQAKSSGWDKRFMEARREIEREINQRADAQKKEAAAAAASVVDPTEFDDRADANAAMLRAAERENKVFEVVEAGGKFKIQPIAEVSDAGTADGNGRRGSDQPAGGNEPAVGNGSVPAGDAGRRPANVGTADRADEQRDAAGAPAADPATVADAALKDAHAGKWFGSQEKADAYVAKKKAGGTHEVVQTGKVRFEVKPRAAEPAIPSNSGELESAPVPDLAGKKIDKEWTAFAADSGTLNIDRAEMPQVKAEHRGALVNYLNARGIAHEQAEVAASDLKPTQREFSPEKVARAKSFDGGDRSILISSDNHVLDGHHQWLAKREDGTPVRVIRLDAPIKQLLEEVKDFPSAQAAAGATAPVAAPAEKVPDLAPTASSETKPASIFADNKLFTEDKVAAARKRMKSKLGTAFTGLDPELVMDGVTLAGAYIEAGTRKFSAYAKAMTDDFGDAIKPYLLSFYEAARHYPGLDTDGMSTPEVAKKQHDAMLADQPAPAAVPAPAMESKPAPAAPVAKVEAPAPAASLRTVFEQAIKTNAMPKDNPALRKMVEAFDGKPADSTRMKQAQEIMEAAIAQVAREIVAKKEGVRTTFDVLQRLYESQPNLNIRTSTSIENQAYSTPAPLAFLASQLAGISKTDTVLEPTAGTGLLLIEAAPGKAVVNELEPFRAELLREQGFTVTEKDATEQLPVAKPVDAVITNPPFGSIKGADGKPVKVKVDGYSLGQIDHLIAARALADMKDGGRATLILGANKVQGGISNADLIFFNWLYSHYNVTGHFEVEGDLYQRQGAGWPVRVISINGRASSGKVSPAAGTVPRAKNWSEVYEQFTNAMDAGRQSDGAAAQNSVRDSFVEAETGPVSKPAGAKAVAAGQPGRASGPAGAGAVAGAIPGTVGDRGGKPAEPVGADAGTKRVDAAPAGADSVEQAGKPAAAKAAKPDGDRRATVSENQFQASYVPRSSRKDEGVLIPVNMAGPTQEALSKLEDEVGDIDAYAAKELGYKSTADLHKAFMGLQVDSVASAIYQIKRGKGVVVADQTGIGKGRQAAAIIRWAVKNGHVPVFVTVKPSLFTDMYGDLADIGTDDVKPFIMNSSESIKGSSDEKLFANKPATHRRNIDRIAGGQLPDGANAIFMTYSQINVANAQRAAIMGIADNAVFILDESHNAGGESATGEFVQSVLALAKGVTYLSATYAKRPDNMPVYFKTDIGDAVADSATLMGAMEAGGLPLQTVVSNNLVRAGQMFRRERSYDGVNIESRSDTGRRSQHEKLSNETTLALRAIVDADKRFHEGFVMDAKIAAEKDGARVLDKAGNQAGESVNHTEFSSVVHNFVRQMLMGLKAQAAADEAIASLARGEKPLIALENTMGSFLAEYAENNNLKAGDKLGAFDYRTVLSRALERTRYITRQLPNGDKVKEYIPLKDLDPVTRESYVEAQKVIDALKLDTPVSPLDWMRNEIAKAGYSVAEITGRNLSVDYSDAKNPVLSSIDPTEQKDKVATTRKFNDGRLDAIILNVAGSTGISLHSSERFADQRQRHMIVAQPAQDINIFMQMLGRIHRTGQVNLPKYTILNVDLPAEKRPTALLSKKMKSLNANTSSNTESATSVKSADMLNKYGDQIIGQFLADNMDLSRSLGISDPMTEQGPMEDVARKATGRLALMPVETQIAFYDEVESQYNSLMEYLNKTNQNDLEPRTFDFDAKELKQAVLFEGANPSSPFGEDAIYGEYSVKAQGKAMTPAEIRAGIEANLAGATAADHVAALIEAGKADYKALVEKMEPERAAGEEQVARNTMAFMREHPIGSAFRVEINGDVYNAIVTNLRSTHKGRGNPFSLSKIQLTVALNGALRSLSVPATQFKRIEVSGLGKAARVDDLFAVQPDNQRETAKIITGNLLAAYGEIAGVKGTVISFTKADGSQEQGILMPKIFDFTKNTVGDYRLRTGADAYKFLMDGNDPNLARFGIATRDGVVRVTPNGQGIQIQVPKSKAKGGKYFLDESLRAIVGDFISSGNHMVARVEQGKAAAAMDALMRKQALYASASMAEGAKAMFTDDALKFSVKGAATGDLNTATLRTAITDGALGPVVGSLIDAGLIVLHETPATLPRNVGNQAQDIQAVTTPDGKVHLVASALSAGNARAVMLHEAFHQGGEKLIGTQQWDALMRRAGQLYRQANQSQGKAKDFFDKARERVYSAYRKGAVEPHMEVEEFAAYAIEEYESAPATVRKWIDDLIGMVKAWALKRFGKQLGALTPAQLSALAKMAVLDVAATRRGEVFGKKGDWFSVAGDTRADPAPAPSPTPTPGPAPAPVDADLTPPEQGRLRKVQAALQNNMNRLRQVQDRIEKLAGAPMRESVDYYGAETNRPGRVAARLEDAERQLTGPLMARLAKSKHTQEQLSELLHAMHAQERNEKIAEFNQDMPDGGSGMTTAEANKVLDKYAAALELHAIADQAREIAAATLDLKLAYGLINDEDHKQLTEVYDNYVPLKGDGEFGPKIKRAMGHDAREEHILENLSRDYNQAVIVGEKNLARQSLLRMVLANPDAELWTVGVPPRGRRIAGQTFLIKSGGETIASFNTLSQATAFAEGRGGNVEITDTKGERIQEYVRPLQDNEVMVYVKGSPVRIQIKDTQLAAQLRPLDQGKMNPILEFMRGTNRYLSKIYTGYNPAFILRNATRDAMTGTISMLGNNGAAIAAKAWSKYPGAVKALGQWAATGNVPDGKTGAYLTEYRMHGGKVGASWMSDLEANGKKLSTMYEDAYGATNYAKDGRPTKAAIVAGRKIVGGMAHIVEIANQATENALRLSLYMAMREKGATPGKAAQAAKTVTVDFDRKGTMTGAMGGIYLFFNPAVQGTANALKTLSKGAHKEQAWAALGSLALLGAYLASRGMDDDRDRWLGEGWETRSKNMIWNVGSHQIRVPVSQEYAPAFSLGMALAEAARGESKIKASARIASSFLDAYFPLQGAHIDGSDNPAMDLSLAMTPTMLKPFAQSAANRSSFGGQIVPENTMTKERPDNLKMFRGTKNSLYDKAAQNIASFGELTGAGKYENDITKVSPETLKMLWRTYTGGLGTFVTDTMGATAMTVSDPKQVEATDWPILKDFWRDSGVKPIRGRYYDLTGEARGAITEFEQAKKAGDGEAMERLFDNPAKAQAISTGRMVKSVNKTAAAIRDGEVDINARTDMTPSEKRAALKDLEKQEEELYRDAIEAFK